MYQNNPPSSWKDAWKVYTKAKVLVMIPLGFSAGLPFLLVFSTLSAWLADFDVSKTEIGFFSWVGITYSIKVFWAPVIDHLKLPFFSKHMGKRRSWMLFAQLLIASGLVLMSVCEPQSHLFWIAVFALLVAFGSATQDIVIDAFRIEAVEEAYQGAMAASYVLGYRLALLAAGAGAFYVAEFYSWSISYMSMASLMLVGVFTVLLVNEPSHAEPVDAHNTYSRSLKERLADWSYNSVYMPFKDFFQSHGKTAIIILLLIGSYKLSDITMGVMANPFYLDKGFSKLDIANVAKIFGFIMTIIGAAVGGVFVVRLAQFRTLLLGSVLILVTNLLFVVLALSDANLAYLTIVISADNFSGGLATSAFIAYLSSLTNRAYTATQYALFSSLMTLPAKFIGGFSGVVVDHAGYPMFFLYAGLLGLPAIATVLLLQQYEKLHPDS